MENLSQPLAVYCSSNFPLFLSQRIVIILPRARIATNTHPNPSSFDGLKWKKTAALTMNINSLIEVTRMHRVNFFLVALSWLMVNLSSPELTQVIANHWYILNNIISFKLTAENQSFLEPDPQGECSQEPKDSFSLPSTIAALEWQQRPGLFLDVEREPLSYTILACRPE